MQRSQVTQRFVLALGAFLCFAPATFAQLTAPNFRYIATNAEIEYDPANGIGNTDVPIRIREVQPSGVFHNVQGWSMGLGHDPAYLSITSISQGAYVATFNGGGGPDFWAASMYPNGFTIGTVYSLIGSITCLYDVSKEVAVINYATVPSALIGDTDGEIVDLTFQGNLGSPPVSNEVIVTGVGYVPVLNNGEIELAVPGDNFIRGDADGSGAISAIADGVMVLAYLFNMGTLNCLDAADSNDDGTINLLDPVLIFNWGFVSGPDPAPPFPLCGTDPTMADPLTCDVPPC